MTEGIGRRRLLRVGMAGLAVGSGGLSGCGLLASDDGQQTPTVDRREPTPSESPTATGTPTPSGRARDHMEAASGALAANNDAFAAFADRVRSTEQSATSFDAATVRDRVATAESELTAAADVATERQLPTIEAMRNLAAAQRPGARFFASHATITRQYNQAAQYNDEKRYEQALAALETVDETITSARDALDSTVSAFQFVQSGNLASVAVAFEPLRTAFETVRARYELLANLVDAFVPFLRGLQQLEDGATAYENSRFSEAATTFASAESNFQRATSVFQRVSMADVNVDTPPGFDASLEQIRCATNAAATAAGFFERSARARIQGDADRAQRLLRQGRDAIQTCQLPDDGSGSGQ